MPPVYKVLILGGGVIGLSLAWQLRRRSLDVTVHDPNSAPNSASSSPPALPQASLAAAGMLAVEDPHNPPELLPLSRLSRSLYDSFLAEIQQLSGLAVPFQTGRTLQTLPGGDLVALSEHSLDPRQLFPALRSAVLRLGVRCTPQAPGPLDEAFDAVVYTTGAWKAAGYPIAPRKGQMLRVALPAGFRLAEVHRAEHVYVVPRRFGPGAGTALLGATVEDAGFDATLSPTALEALRSRAAELVPDLVDRTRFPEVEAWAGFRPATPDGLPFLGELPAALHGPVRARRHFVATGHYRNGILLAPGTAAVLADLLEDKTPAVPLDAFAPDRFPRNAN